MTKEDNGVEEGRLHFWNESSFTYGVERVELGKEPCCERKAGPVCSSENDRKRVKQPLSVLKGLVPRQPLTQYQSAQMPEPLYKMPVPSGVHRACVDSLTL